MGMMPFEVSHNLPQEEAKQRVAALLNYWKNKYGIVSSWNGESASLQGKAMGISIDGSLKVEASRVGGEAKDPGMLFRGQAQKYLTRKFAEYLDASKPLDSIQKADT